LGSYYYPIIIEGFLFCYSYLPESDIID